MEFLRVVRLRKGKLKPTEFMLREGERGLSLFASVEYPSSDDVLDAVRSAGKQGELAVAVIQASDLKALGLTCIRCPGATPNPEINAIHYEIRPSLVWRLSCWIRGRSVHDSFNEQFSERILELAKLE